jgi:hypothetical protein
MAAAPSATSYPSDTQQVESQAGTSTPGAGQAVGNNAAGQNISEAGWQASIPANWTRTNNLPQGLDVGFQKEIEGGGVATIFFHFQSLPQEVLTAPTDVSMADEMARQWDSMVTAKFPDANTISGSAPNVNGRLLINKTYQMTDNGEFIRRRYTYFMVDTTAFVVQCSAPPAQWDNVVKDFDAFIESLQPGISTIAPVSVSDSSATEKLNQSLPVMLNSYPADWKATLKDVTIRVLPPGYWRYIPGNQNHV